MKKQEEPTIDPMHPLGIDTKEEFVKNINLNISNEANEIREAIAKVKKLNDFLKFETDKSKPQTEVDYVMEYAKHAYKYLVKSLKYDTASWNYLKSIYDGSKEYYREYNKYLSLRFAILRNTGVCRQFAEYLTMLISNDESGIAQNCKAQNIHDINVFVKMRCNKATLVHQLNAIELLGHNNEKTNLIVDIIRGKVANKNGLNQMDFFTDSINKFSNKIEATFNEFLQPAGDTVEYLRAPAEELYYLTQCHEYPFGNQDGFVAKQCDNLFERFK